jgi:hypothetical protein
MFLLFFLYLISTTHAHKCCSTCACAKTCHPPNLSAYFSSEGLSITCFDATCACVLDELDTCTYGSTWDNQTLIPWKDHLWHKCIEIDLTNSMHARAILRWWKGHCMGHMILEIDIHLEPVFRDVFIDFNVIHFFEHTSIHNIFYIQTQSGCNDTRPMAGKSDMFFEAILTNTTANVHVEITNCTVQIIEGDATDATILKEINVYNGNKKTQIEKGERMTYTAFWDDETNSPFQRLVCSYALFNGTIDNKTFVGNYVNSRTYRMANPDETGILID